MSVQSAGLLPLSEQVWMPDEGLSDIEASVQETAHRFAVDVLRPYGKIVDRMTPDEVIADGSPFWDAHKQYHKLDLGLMEIGSDLTPLEKARLSYLVNEELGWGDCGLGWSLYGANCVQSMLKTFGRDDLTHIAPPGSISMWSLTEPNHGTDMVDFSHSQSPKECGGKRSDCVAVKKGDKYIINGQKSAWASNGSIATSTALFTRLDDGTGEAKRAVFVLPLDLPGISRGKPIAKIGARGLTDAEIFFQDVEIPESYLICPPEAYDRLLRGVIMNANPSMSVFCLGVARAAFEHALKYSKERIQGGRPIFEYQGVQLKLFEMYRQVQASRKLIRSTLEDHAKFKPRIENSVTCKVTVTQMAVNVTNLAFDLFGGNGTTQEYPIEKLIRDARMGTVADGTNDVLPLIVASTVF